MININIKVKPSLHSTQMHFIALPASTFAGLLRWWL